MKHITLFLAIICAFGQFALAQVQPTVQPMPVQSAPNQTLVQFDKTEHDYGMLSEDATPKADYTFSFTNISGGPIKVIDAKASCGCTTPSWTKEVIANNQKGFVMSSYSTKNRPGPFNKTITVTAAKVDPKTGAVDSNAKSLVILRIKGDVTPRSKGPVDWYPFEDGNLRYSTNHVAFGKVTERDVMSKEVVIYNQGDKAIKIDSVQGNQKVVVKFKNEVKTLNPQDSIRMTVTYDATKVNDWDWQHERVYLYTNDDSTTNSYQKNEPGKKTIYVSATIEPFFPDMNKADSAKAPKINFDKFTHDFGEINEGETVKTKFVFSNSGKSDLQILKTKASCGCTAGNPLKTMLKPGESSEIDVSFNSTGKKGDQMKQVTVITNDPSQPSIKLNIKAKVNEVAGGGTTPTPTFNPVQTPTPHK